MSVELMPLLKDRTLLLTIARVGEKVKVNVIPANAKEGEDQGLTTPLSYTASPEELDPEPVMVIGRLAVDQTAQGQALGPALLRDAVLRTVQAAEIAGIRAILVHAISQRAKRFYEKWGFIASPVEPMTLMITVAEAGKAMQDKSE